MQRRLAPLKTILESAMDVLAERAHEYRMHAACCVCSLCNLQRAVDYQNQRCGLSTCGVRRHEHHEVNEKHRFFEHATVKGNKPTTAAGKARRRQRLQEIASRD